ncbi:hypothetical protein QZH41_009057 [Actinostola sp. cb2023]|nr:hypothetical protein QZH41_009057 [Actinostola sp. cb2023]
MLKRRLSSSSSEEKIPKKSKTSSLTEDQSEKHQNLFSARKSNASKSSPRKNVPRTTKKTNSPKKQSNRNILRYLQSCPAVASRSNLAADGDAESAADEKYDGTKQNKQTICNEYCPQCQMPVTSDGQLLQEHVWQCIERTFEFEGPCPKGLLCDEQNCDHFQTYNHYLLAESRSTKGSHSENNPDVSKEACSTQTNEVIVHSDDDDDLISEHPSNGKKDTNLKVSPLCKLTIAMENIHKPKDGCFSKCKLLVSHNSDTKVSTEDVATMCKNDQDSVPLKQEVDDHFCDDDNDDDDELLANLVNSENMYNVVPDVPKYTLSNNKCTQDDAITKSTIFVDTKQHPSNNKCLDETLTVDTCTIQKVDIKPQDSETSKCCTKQSDIGTYFGLQPLMKSLDQSTQSKQGKMQLKSTFNEGGIGDAHNNDVTMDNAAIGGRYGAKKCPFYKKIPGTPFVVDAFEYGAIPGVKVYFLSHFHWDHYRGLKSRFSCTIYCSKITANLIKSKIKVDPRFIKELPLNVPSPVDKVQVTLLEANHCPGAVLFLFELPTGENYLHTGDFRASPSMSEYAALRNKHINTLFLDTTYCDPAYSFPSQDETVQFAVRKSLEAKQKNPKTLIVCGTYTIGKEKVFLAIAEALKCKVSVTREKKRILDCLESDKVSSVVSLDWNAGGVHVFRMNDLNSKTLKDHLEKYKQSFTEVLAFKPTGWEHKSCSLDNIRPSKSGPVTIYGVPYSEHSSYKELERFVKFIRPDNTIPTVNVHRSKEQTAIINTWL